MDSQLIGEQNPYSLWVFTLQNVVKRYEYDVITWSTAVKLRAQLEPVSVNGGPEIRKFVAAFLYLNCQYIYNFIYIEECFTIKLVILCVKMRKKLMSIFIELALWATTSTFLR